MRDSVVRIGNKTLRNGGDVFVVGEIGINHNGFVDIAKSMIKMAAEAGCDAVKFQKRTVPIVYSPGPNYDPGSLDKPRQVKREVLENAVRRGVLSPKDVARLASSNYENSTNGDLKWALEFTLEEYKEIDNYCSELGIMWFASPWDELSVDFLENFNPPCYKVASATLTDDLLLQHIRNQGRPVILSTGMSSMEMIRRAVAILGRKDLVLLHCTSVYPQGLDAGDKILKMINLGVIETLRKEFPGIPVGFSSHDSGIIPTFAAVAMGACMIEKHITLERSMWGSDQASSIEPNELRTLCRWTREFQIAKGDGVKVVYPEEVGVMKKLRRK